MPMRTPLLSLFAALVAAAGLTAQNLLRDINPGSVNSLPARFVDVFGTTFFSASAPGTGHALWRTDGTPGGTLLVKDFYPGSGGGVQPRELTGLGALLLCIADDGVHGGELWVSDGTTAGTVMVRDLNPGNQGQPVYMDPPVNLTPYRGRVFFSARDGVHGRELWATDGTTAGTALIRDINPGGNSSDSHPSYLTRAGDLLFFFGFEPATGWELWRTDGTTIGTQRVADVWPGPEPTLMTHNSYQFNTGVLGDRLVFAVPDGTHGMELWISDGTTAGTSLLADINPGPTDTYIARNLTAAGGLLYFTADDGIHGRELWRTDGTTAGTVLVADIVPGAQGSDPGFMAAVGSRVVFSADDGVHGRELWTSDGTAAGTVLVRDILPGSGSGLAFSNLYSGPTPVGSRHVWFTADDGVHGNEPWRSDGTAAGTVMVADVSAGFADSNPEFFTHSDGRVVFRASDPVNGQEPRVIFPGATAQRRGESCPWRGPRGTLAADDPVLGGPLAVSGRAALGALPMLLAFGLAGPPVAIGGDCEAYLDLGVVTLPVLVLPPPSGDWTYTDTLPATPALAGTIFGVQALQLRPATALGFDASNGLVMTLGS